MELNIVATKPVDGTPFVILTNEEQNLFEAVEGQEVCDKVHTYYISIGNQLISEVCFETEEQAMEYIEMKPWELILNAITYLTNYFIYQKNLVLTKENSKEE